MYQGTKFLPCTVVCKHTTAHVSEDELIPCVCALAVWVRSCQPRGATAWARLRPSSARFGSCSSISPLVRKRGTSWCRYMLFVFCCVSLCSLLLLGCCQTVSIVCQNDLTSLAHPLHTTGSLVTSLRSPTPYHWVLGDITSSPTPYHWVLGDLTLLGSPTPHMWVLGDITSSPTPHHWVLGDITRLTHSTPLGPWWPYFTRLTHSIPLGPWWHH